jgi:hypothetical protein
MPVIISNMLFKLDIFPLSIDFLNLKCALWDCPSFFQGSNESNEGFITRLDQNSFDPYFQGVCGRESNSQLNYCHF